MNPSNRIVRPFRLTERATFASGKPVCPSGAKPTNTGFVAIMLTIAKQIASQNLQPYTQPASETRHGNLKRKLRRP